MSVVNEKIIAKINEIKCDPNIKQFLKEILSFELDHFEEDRWLFRKKYENSIKKFIKNFKVE